MIHLKGRKKHCSQTCNQRTKANRLWIKNLTKLYGITELDYKLKLIKQNYRCAICREPETAIRNGRLQRLVVDHCHESGQVRGLLCMRCNLTIGLIKDHWLILDNAQDYVGYWSIKHGSSKVKLIQESPSLN